MTVIYTKNYKNIYPRKMYGNKGISLLLDKTDRDPTVDGSGFVTTSNVVGGILSNHPKKKAPAPPAQEVTPIGKGSSSSLLDKVAVPTFRKSKKENRNNIKLVL